VADPTDKDRTTLATTDGGSGDAIGYAATTPARPAHADARDAITEDGAAAQPGTDELEVGTQLDRYVVTGRLGAGGMAVVYAAHDPALHRRVALKVLPRLRSAAQVAHLEARLRREAQALARLSHPNVLAVYDVGIAADRVFLGLQLVDGATLHAVLAERSRPPAEILALFIAAARGLAAAHDAGIIHRDVKPSNILVDRDGRVYVGDFGLARGTDDVDAADRGAPVSLLDETVTHVGSVMGTPRYMAPEQHRGEPATARSDQFSLCVALWEALFGAHPFAAGRWQAAEVIAAMEADAPIAPARVRGVRPRVMRALARGLRHDPDQRWPSIDALIAELTPRARAARWWATASVVAMAGIAAIAVFVDTREADPRAACRAGVRRLNATWPARSAEVRAAIAASKVPDADGIAGRAVLALDRQAAAWRRMRRDACEDDARHADVTHALRDVELRCLDDHRQALELLVSYLATADRVALAHAVETVDALPRLQDCAVAALAPVAPARSTDLLAISEVRAELSRARTLIAAGQVPAARALLGRLAARAETLAHPPLVAEVLLVQASIDDDEARSAAALERATELALGSRADRTAALALTEAVKHAANRSDANKVGVLLPLARAAARRTDDPLIALEFDAIAGFAAMRDGHDDDAIALCETSLFGLSSRAAWSGSAASCLTMTYLQRADTAAAARWAELYLSLAEAHYGRGTLGTAHALGELGYVRRHQGRFDDALALDQRALDIYDGVFGPDSPGAIQYLQTRAELFSQLGRLDEALAIAERVVAINRKHDVPPSSGTFEALLTVGQIQQQLELPAAADSYREALALGERILPEDDVGLASLRLAYGTLLAVGGEVERGLALMARAEASLRRSGNHQAAAVAIQRGELLHQLGKHAEAVPVIEAGVHELEAAGGDAFLILTGKLDLAYARWDARLDRPRARQLMQEVHDGSAKLGEAGASYVAETAAWLRAHP
jgi:tetratricopeptide (TPR) repeat protein